LVRASAAVATMTITLTYRRGEELTAKAVQMCIAYGWMPSKSCLRKWLGSRSMHLEIGSEWVRLSMPRALQIDRPTILTKKNLKP
jgi:hypothetical protein